MWIQKPRWYNHANKPGSAATGHNSSKENFSYLIKQILGDKYDGRYYKDLTEKKSLVESIDGSSHHSVVAELHFSEWSPDFVHGADVIPSITEAISHYLQEQGHRLWDVKKIRFNETHDCDVILLMSKNEEKILIKNLSHYWESLPMRMGYHTIFMHVLYHHISVLHIKSSIKISYGEIF